MFPVQNGGLKKYVVDGEEPGERCGSKSTKRSYVLQSSGKQAVMVSCSYETVTILYSDVMCDNSGTMRNGSVRNRIKQCWR